MRNDPFNEDSGSPSPKADDVTLKRIVYPDGRWSEITMDTKAMWYRWWIACPLRTTTYE